MPRGIRHPVQGESWCDVDVHRNCPGQTEDDYQADLCLCTCHEDEGWG
jgi:hypothetical protein